MSVWTWCLFFQGVGCTFYCFGLFTQLRDLVNFCIKKNKRAVHKTPASTNLFFLNSALRLRPLFTLCRFPGNPILAVLLPWELRSPSQVCVVSTWMTLSKDACRDPSFITLFFSGSKVTELTYMTANTSPIPPPHPHSSDRLQTQMARSNLIFMINETSFQIALSCVFNTAFTQLSTLAPLGNPSSAAAASTQRVLYINTYSYCHVKNSPWDLQQVFQYKHLKKDSYIG